MGPLLEIAAVCVCVCVCVCEGIYIYGNRENSHFLEKAAVSDDLQFLEDEVDTEMNEEELKKKQISLSLCQ